MPSEGRNSQLIRFLRVLHYLEANPQGLTVKEIQKKLKDENIEIKERSIYRDFEALEGARFPLSNIQDGERTVWKLEKAFSLSKNVAISYQDLLGFYFSRESIKNLKGSPIFESMESFFLKLEKLFGAHGQEDLGEIGQYLKIQSRFFWHIGVPQSVFDTLNNACIEGHGVSFKYKANSGNHKGEFKERTVGPEAIYFYDNGVYLIAKEICSEKIKTYSLSRMTDVVMLDTPYEQEKIIPEKYFQDNIGALGLGDIENVIIHISEPIASYVAERRWHESQSVVRTPIGIELKMKVKVNLELTRWVLSLGSNAKVTEPYSLIEMLIEESHAIHQQYKMSMVS